MADGTTDTTTPENEHVAIDLGADDKHADVFEKHLDIAIEAQDGKVEAASGEQTTSAQAEDKQAKTGDATSGGTGKDDNKEQGADKEAAKDTTNADTPGPKDLVLKGEGPNGTDLVIKGGAERRLYESARVARDRATSETNRANQMHQQRDELKQKLAATEQAVQSVQGMPPQQVATAARMFQDLQRDPVGTMQKLLAEMTAKGYKIEGIAQGVDIAAVTAAVRAELGASLQTQQGPTDAEIEAEAQAEANTFFSQFPDARLHDGLIAKVMHDNPGVDLHSAYFGLREQFIARGFDWSRSLDEQLAEKAKGNENNNANEQQNGQQQQNNSQQGTTGVVPLPGARPNSAAVASTDANGTGIVAHESESMDDIIRQSMRESGLKV